VPWRLPRSEPSHYSVFVVLHLRSVKSELSGRRPLLPGGACGFGDHRWASLRPLGQSNEETRSFCHLLTNRYRNSHPRDESRAYHRGHVRDEDPKSDNAHRSGPGVRPVWQSEHGGPLRPPRARRRQSGPRAPGVLVAVSTTAVSGVSTSLSQ